MDLFQPDRKLPAEKAPEAKQTVQPGNTPRLFGTIILGDKKTAILEDPDTKATKIYSINDSIAGYVVSEISSNKVVLLLNDESVEDKLQDEKKGIADKTQPHPAKRAIARRQKIQTQDLSRRLRHRDSGIREDEAPPHRHPKYPQGCGAGHH